VRSPASQRHPEHHIEVRPSGVRARAEFAGRTIAESTRALRVLESRHGPVLYFPRNDVVLDCLEPSGHTTFCPFKGTASYFSVRVGSEVAPDAVWTYADPYDDVAELRGHLAFYAERIGALTEF
jgi:uncharacterized protein (DUF427 family)